ncbi:MAG TPA: glycoside hydrolase domain-containing protein [Bryobacteraceae bacterium]|nr:glycoside hydrolase domain-containing protein [Bryobacteraceae bacterium]
MNTVFLFLAGAALMAPPEVALRVAERMMLPCDIEKLGVVERPAVSMAAGEAEPIALLVTTTAALENEPLTIRGLPRGVRAEVRIASPYRRRLARNREATQPFLLEAVDSVTMREPGKSVYWILLRADETARAGHYAVSFRLRDATARVSVTVRPFRLRRDHGVFYGAFCGARDRDITPAHMRDLRERGFDALQFFWGSLTVPLSNDAGTLAVDFSFVDRWMAEFTKAGMKGPVVWSLGNDSVSHLENRLSDLFNIPRPEPVVVDGKRKNFSDVNNPELNRRLKELMLAIKRHAAEQKWPELVFLIYDEPTERLMEEHENRYKFIKSFWPELRIYGVTMDRIAWAKAINHMVDILVANGDFDEIRGLAEQSGKPFWMYGSASGRDEASLRQAYAWRPWLHKGNAVWFWAYNYHPGDPFDDFDGGSADSGMSMVWPPRTADSPFPYSVSWEGMREAADDMAYVKTLEWMLEQTSSPRAREIRAGLDGIKAKIPSGRRVRVAGGDAHDTVERVDAGRFVTESRDAVAGWIEELLKLEKGRFREIRVR